MSDWVELRSDTFTKPSRPMRHAMASAEVGDDVFSEDPTVNALQESAAARFGKEAALFVPTGSMGNETAIKVLTSPGDEIVVEEHAHVVLYELGAPATISQVMIKSVPGAAGVMDADDVAAALRAPSALFNHTSLVCMENTHNFGGGTVWPLEDFRAVAKVAHEHDCAVFLDGARIFNASIASGIPVSEYAAEVDALSFCFSKGLGAPIGSMLVGSAEFIAEARKVRRMLGGGMRQVGVLAAAAAYAFDNNIERLAEDHANARHLAEGFAEALPGSVDPATVMTNMVVVDLLGRNEVVISGALWDAGVRILPTGASRLRAVTHLDVDRDGIDRAIVAFRDVIASA